MFTMCVCNTGKLPGASLRNGFFYHSALCAIFTAKVGISVVLTKRLQKEYGIYGTK